MNDENMKTEDDGMIYNVICIFIIDIWNEHSVCKARAYVDMSNHHI